MANFECNIDQIKHPLLNYVDLGRRKRAVVSSIHPMPIEPPPVEPPPAELPSNVAQPGSYRQSGFRKLRCRSWNSIRRWEKENELLFAMIEDESEWIASLFPNEVIAPEYFFFALEDGVLLCKLSQLIQQHAEKYCTDCGVECPQFQVKFHKRTRTRGQLGQFLARENVHMFLNWCRVHRIPEVILFESNDIVQTEELREGAREVVICLMEVARMAFKYGVKPPKLVLLENEIEMEERGECHRSGTNSPSSIDSGVDTENFLLDMRRRDSVDGHAQDVANHFDKQCDKTPKLNGDSVDGGPHHDTPVLPKSELDERVQTLVKEYDVGKIYRLKEGKYIILGRIMFVRMLNDHLLVRIGGGWDGLEHYLMTHTTQRKHSRQVTPEQSTSLLHSGRRTPSPTPTAWGKLKEKVKHREGRAASSPTFNVDHQPSENLSPLTSASPVSWNKGKDKVPRKNSKYLPTERSDEREITEAIRRIENTVSETISRKSSRSKSADFTAIRNRLNIIQSKALPSDHNEALMEGEFSRTETSTTIMESTVTYVNGDLCEHSSVEGHVCNGDIQEEKETLIATMSDVPVENVPESSVLSSESNEAQKLSTDTVENAKVSAKSSATKKETSKTTKNSAKTAGTSKATHAPTKPVANKASKPAVKSTSSASDATKKPTSAVSSSSHTSNAVKKSSSVTKTVTKTSETKSGKAVTSKVTTSGTTATSVNKSTSEGNKKPAKPSSAGSSSNESKQTKPGTPKSNAVTAKTKETEKAKTGKDIKSSKPTTPSSSTKSAPASAKKTVTDGPPPKKEPPKKDTTKAPTKPDAKKDAKPASATGTKPAPKPAVTSSRPTSAKKALPAAAGKDGKASSAAPSTKPSTSQASSLAAKAKPSTPPGKASNAKTKPPSSKESPPKPKAQDEKAKSTPASKTKEAAKDPTKAAKKTASEKSDAKPSSAKQPAKSEASVKKSATTSTAAASKTSPTKDTKKATKPAPTTAPPKAKVNQEAKTKKSAAKPAKEATPLIADIIAQDETPVSDQQRTDMESIAAASTVTAATTTTASNTQETVELVETGPEQWPSDSGSALPQGEQKIVDDVEVLAADISLAECSPNTATLEDDTFASEVLATAKQDFVVECIDSEAVFEKKQEAGDHADESTEGGFVQSEQECVTTVDTVSLDPIGLTSQGDFPQDDLSYSDPAVYDVGRESAAEETVTQTIHESARSFEPLEMECMSDTIEFNQDTYEHNIGTTSDKHSVFTPEVPFDSHMDSSTPDVDIADKANTSLSSLSATPEPASCSIWTPEVSDIDQMSDVARDSDEGRIDEHRLAEISQEPTRTEDEIPREGAMAPTPPLSMEPDLPSIRDSTTRQVDELELSGPFASPPTTDTSLKEVDSDMKLEEQLERLEKDHEQFDSYSMYSGAQSADTYRDQEEQKSFLAKEKLCYGQEMPTSHEIRDTELDIAAEKGNRLDSEERPLHSENEGPQVEGAALDSKNLQFKTDNLQSDWEKACISPALAESGETKDVSFTETVEESSLPDSSVHSQSEYPNFEEHNEYPGKQTSSVLESSDSHVSYDSTVEYSSDKSFTAAPVASVLYDGHVEHDDASGQHSISKDVGDVSHLISSSYTAEEDGSVSSVKSHTVQTGDGSPVYRGLEGKTIDSLAEYDTTDFSVKVVDSEEKTESTEERKDHPDILGADEKSGFDSQLEVGSSSSGSGAFFNVEQNSQSEVIHSYEEISMKDAPQLSPCDPEKGDIGQSYEVIGVDSAQSGEFDTRQVPVSKDLESSGFEEISTQSVATKEELNSFISSDVEHQSEDGIRKNIDDGSPILVTQVEDLAPSSTSWEVPNTSQDNGEDLEGGDGVDARGKKVTIHPEFIHVEKSSSYAPLASPDPESDDERSESEDESRLSDEEIRVNINGVTGPGASAAALVQESGSDVEDQSLKIDNTVSETSGYSQTPEPLLHSGDDYPVHSVTLEDSFKQHFTENVTEVEGVESSSHDSKAYSEELMGPSEGSQTGTLGASCETGADGGFRAGFGEHEQSAGEEEKVEADQQFQQVSNEANGYVVVDSTRDLLDRQYGNGTVPATQLSERSDVSQEDSVKDIHVISSSSGVEISQGYDRTDSPFHHIEYDALDPGAKAGQAEFDSSIDAEADALGENSSACFGDNSPNCQEQGQFLTSPPHEAPTTYQHYSYEVAQENDGTHEVITHEYVETSTSRSYTEGDDFRQEMKEHDVAGLSFLPATHNAESLDGESKLELADSTAFGPHTVEYSSTHYHHQEMSGSVPVECGTMIDCQGDLTYTMSWEEKHTHEVTTTHYAFDADDNDETY